jgi:tetratricopeptide (TPR) repeat protein
VNAIRSSPETTQPSSLERRVFLLLAGVALIYAMLAGLRTVSDPDLGWQLATGRWVAQHHRVVSYDVFSYTAQGQPWIYPVGSGLLFYAVFLLGGYTLLSWFGAAACVATVALLLRRGSAFSAALAVLAVPLIAERTTPRAEMFTVILFAAFLSILWQNYQTGRAPLWLLPLLMIAWVNLHLGFVAGLALIGAFAAVELLRLLAPLPARSDALQRLRRLGPWLLATAAATLLNPWGWNVYQALVRQNRVMSQHTQLIDEWASSGWGWLRAIPSFALQPVQHTLAVLLWIAFLAAVIGLLLRRPFPAILLLAAAYACLRHLRFEALAACIVVVLAGAVLFSTISALRTWMPNPRWRSLLALAGAIVIVLLAAVRATSFVDGHFYLRSNHLAGFGAGLGWWAPQAAAEFIAREHLPGNLFNTYNLGGYLLWTLGPLYPDYIDGRAVPFGLQALPHQQQLLATSLDSPEWQQEADRYNINSMILPLEGYEIPLQQLSDLCHASDWRPVYLDDLAIVLLRRTPQTQPLLDRLQVNCATASLPAQPLHHSAADFPRWVNAAYVLLALNRNSEALAAADTAMQIFSENARLHAIRGNILFASHRPSAAEQEWLTSISLQPDAAVWSGLGELYEQQQRIPEAAHAWQEAVRQTANPALKARSLLRLARLYVETGHGEAALQALDEGVSIAPPQMVQPGSGRNFRFNVAQARAAAWWSLHDLPRAISFQEEAVQLDPNAADAWAHLAKLYGRQGRVEDERRAAEHATALASTSDSH